MRNAMCRLVRCITLLAWMSCGVALAQADRPRSDPLSPADELATMRLADRGLRITLVASEPEIVSPVAAAWDEDGHLFVVEMTDYPAGPRSGRLRRLEDRDGDGRYEHATRFAEGLNLPSGVLPWNDGVLVTAAPDILFLKDNDRDGVADEQRVVLTGFHEGNPQLRVNGLTWGADNWVYGANGRSDGIVRRPGDPPEKALALRQHDFRFRPQTGEVEAIAGFSQFGLPRDDRGDRFPSWNTIPIRHVVIEERTLARNPYLAESASVAVILDPADGGRVYPISPSQATFNRESTAYFNATCGPTIYRGDLLGDAYRGNAFVCESLTNLVQRRVLEPRGATYLARRAEPEREFLAATDPAFRPVNLATGPDGALYVVDFYREMVEHPQFVPQDLRKSVEFRRWSDRGRLWRIAPATDGAQRAPRLSTASTAGLVATLSHPNGWWRDTAQRLLVERQNRSAAPALMQLCADPEVSPLARMHALWTLDGLTALDDAIVARAMEDAHPDMREAAVRLAAGRPGLTRSLLTRAEDAAFRVRFRAAIALGDVRDPAVPQALARLAARDAGDAWMRLAILSGLGETAWPFLQALLETRRGAVDPDQATLLAQAAAIVGVRNRQDEVRALLGSIAQVGDEQPTSGRIALLGGLADGLARVGHRLAAVLAGLPPSGSETVGRLLARAADSATSATEPPAARARALILLARGRPEAAASVIPSLLSAAQPDEVRSAAARGIREVGSPDLASRVFGNWSALSTHTRREVLAALTGSPTLAPRVVDAIEDDTIGLTELSHADRDALRVHRDPALRQRVELLFARSAPKARGDVIRKLQGVLALTGDPARGAPLFAQNCQNCHQRRGAGQRVGPDLSGVSGRPAAALLKDILDPSADLTPEYAGVVVATRSGLALTGLLVEETSASLKLRSAGGVEESVLRSELDVLRPSGRSLMPEGFEDTLGPQGLADVIAFLRQP